MKLDQLIFLLTSKKNSIYKEFLRTFLTFSKASKCPKKQKTIYQVFFFLLFIFGKMLMRKFHVYKEFSFFISFYSNSLIKLTL